MRIALAAKVLAFSALTSGALGQEVELVFTKKPVECAPLAFEVRIPAGWDVAQTKMGLSARSGKSGFVITREPSSGKSTLPA